MECPSVFFFMQFPESGDGPVALADAERDRTHVDEMTILSGNGRIICSVKGACG